MAVPIDPLSRPNVLVLHFGQLGDAVLALPGLDHIRDALPTASLSVACGRPVGELLDIWGRADHVVPLDRVLVRDTNKPHALGLMLGYALKLRHVHPDAALVLHPNREMNLMGWLAGARRRMGVVFKPSFFNRFLTERIEGSWKHQHAGLSYIQAACRFCGGVAPETPPLPRLRLAAQPVRSDEVVIHTGAGNRRKVLAPERWLEVARAVRGHSGRRIVFVSGPEEPGQANRLAGEMDGAIGYSGLTMRQLANLLARARFFIGSDSGPGHLAAALQTPTLTLIQDHVATRYRTLGPQAVLVRYGGNIRDLALERVIDAALDHPRLRVPNHANAVAV